VLVAACAPTTSTPPPTAAPPTAPALPEAGITAITIGALHTCALSRGGGVKCWGSNGRGQLGDGTTTDSSVAVTVSGLSSDVTAIAAGDEHTCALTAGGGVKCWGLNDTGQLGDGTKSDSSMPVDVVGFTSGVSAIAAGGLGTCALVVDGGIVCWGVTYRSRTEVDAGDVTSIAAGFDHACAARRVGGIACWGFNTFGQLGNGTTSASFTRVAVDVSGITERVRAFAVGHESTCAVTAAAGVKCWGQNHAGQLGDGTYRTSHVPVEVSDLAGEITGIAAGSHACAVTSAARVMCWGANGSGQLGNGANTDSNVPVVVEGLASGAIVITAGSQHSCVVTASDEVDCWGRGTEGQLGDGGGADRNFPVRVLGLADAEPPPTAAPSTPGPTGTAPAPSAMPALWTATGEIGTPRRDHTATLLSDGKVLVAGGSDDSNLLAAAELYDPSSGSWHTVGRLAVPRSGHTATLLPDGTVLVAGDYDDRSGLVLDFTETFDPSSGMWTAAGKMVTARTAHTATLLPDGRVLVAGGSAFGGHGEAVRAAELYDPGSRSWTATRRMFDARWGHAATLLPAGRVLLAGGFGDLGALQSAERYDPTSGSWAATASMDMGRAKFTATLLLDGTVLVAGLGARRSAEIYDAGRGAWATTGRTIYHRANDPTATRLPDGRVLLTGGASRDTQGDWLLAFAELYDPGSRSWTRVGEPLTARYSHTATLLRDGRVLLVGGTDIEGVLATAEIYDPMLQ